METRDLSRAIEDVTGRNLDPFFDRWVARPGHPELDCRWQWDDERRVGRWRLEQKQHISDEAPAFQFDVGVRFEVDGVMQDQTISITERSHLFEFRLPERPTQVVFDPGDVILKTIKTDKPQPLWRRQLEAAELAVDRILAARALAEAPTLEGIAALGTALADDRFWGVRAAAARALGKTRRQDALELLLTARRQSHPRVRRAVATALGDFRGEPRAGAALAAWLRAGDPSVFVEAEAALALGRTRVPEALELLPTLFDRPAYQDLVRTRAIEGLGATGDERAVAVLRAAWRGGGPFQSRRAFQAEYPTLWPETIRGLLVHSAEWTDRMWAAFGDRKADHVNRLRRYGYGVPNLARARRWSCADDGCRANDSAVHKGRERHQNQ